MGNRSNFRLAIWVSATLLLSVPTWGSEKANLGKGKYGTKSFVSEACTESEISSMLAKEDPKVKEHEEAAKACFEQVKKADQTCQPSSNPNAQSAQQQANSYTQNTNQQTAAASAAGGMGGGGQSNACGGLGDLMKNMQPPLNKYNEQCTGAREQCKTTCEEKKKASSEACAELPEDKKIICMKNAEIVEKCTKKTSQACQKYEMQTNGILAAIANAAMQMMQMQGCQEDQGLDCTTDPTNAQCLKDDTPNCTDPNSLKNPDVAEKCRCLANARAPGCPGSDSAGLSEIARKANSAANTSTLNDPTPGNDNSPLTSPNRPNAANAPSLGGPGGGMPSGAGRAASDSTGTAAGGAKAPSGDILSGDYGGGGGGRGGMGGGFPDVPNGVGRALRNADMRRDPATAKQLTGGNGRSNWQKIKERFVDNRPTLISPN